MCNIHMQVKYTNIPYNVTCTCIYMYNTIHVYESVWTVSPSAFSITYYHLSNTCYLQCTCQTSLIHVMYCVHVLFTQYMYNSYTYKCTVYMYFSFT